ncbi:transcriptional regulator domain-containing protein [Dokdonella koreensis]|uniref:transcriptional regulator domain-containing protein n=1 Tax=Dokdonella koreensis TaxID=323415 RepID=UPI003CCCBCA5
MSYYASRRTHAEILVKYDCSPWETSAAYLYVLRLGPPALAWEYLRRNSGYRREWQTLPSASRLQLT